MQQLDEIKDTNKVKTFMLRHIMTMIYESNNIATEKHECYNKCTWGSSVQSDKTNEMRNMEILTNEILMLIRHINVAKMHTQFIEIPAASNLDKNGPINRTR